jgi:N-methylhydantoinase A
MAERVGAEIGGTFTDLVWAKSDGTLGVAKVPSTPSEIEKAVLDAIADAGIDLKTVDQVAHGSTVATNALLTRRGAQAGLITTLGFRDVMEIGTHDRIGNIYNILYRKPASPIPRRLVREVDERINAAGEILTPIDLEAAWAEVQALIDQGVDAIAICFLHAYNNPAHEKLLAELVRERAPGLPVFASHEVSPEFREFERTMTTAVNAFVGPVVERYIGSLDTKLRGDGYDGVLGIMQSNGGMMPAAAAGSNAVRMLLSGPAAGVRAAVWFARRNGIENIITLDMGGTSTDVAIAPGLVPRMVPELLVDDLPIRTTAVDMATIGAGGGSIGAIDAGGFLAVGPQSAGAVPGPACYGRGGNKPTVTDAQIMAGILRPARFFGGQMTLRPDLAEQALAGIGLPGGAREAADAVLRMVNGNMAGAVRLVSTARGIDPRDYTLVAYGGGGPLHGAQVAEEIGITRVLVPWSPGLTSAFGLLVADTIIDVVQTRLHPLGDETLNAARIAGLHELAAETARAMDLEAGSYESRIGLDMRYGGQAFELAIWTDGKPKGTAELREMFEKEHILRYGYARGKLPVEIVNYRMQLIRRMEGVGATPLPDGRGDAPETAQAIVGGTVVDATFHPRTALTVGKTIAGPAVVEEPTSTTLVPPGWNLTVLASGDLLLERAP